ncbi:hypothetical protein BP6252_01289 [Coleophoma cylindrospora]|uniref:Uncharacterized protein n=1 Tax=Coleophoma cylindrospora TaxID=1849047 RepID=A0A3D8SSI0_9HELO|nr:hypothetical protein BP6252_01289 [Coleophoma cylindrospora]
MGALLLPWLLESNFGSKNQPTRSIAALQPAEFYKTTYPEGPLIRNNLSESVLAKGLGIPEPVIGRWKGTCTAVFAQFGIDANVRFKGHRMVAILNQMAIALRGKFPQHEPAWKYVDGINSSWVATALMHVLLRHQSNLRRMRAKPSIPNEPPNRAIPDAPANITKSHVATTSNKIPFSEMIVDVNDGEEEWSDVLRVFRTDEAKDREPNSWESLDFRLDSLIAALSDPELSPFEFDATKSRLVGIHPDGTRVELKYPGPFRVLLQRTQEAGHAKVSIVIEPHVLQGPSNAKRPAAEKPVENSAGNPRNAGKRQKLNKD